MGDEMVFISKNDLYDLLSRAYESGWKGYLDLKDATAEELLEGYLATKARKPMLSGGHEAYSYNFLFEGQPISNTEIVFSQENSETYSYSVYDGL